MNWKEYFLQWVWTNAGGKSVAVNAVLGYAEDEVAGQPRTGPAGSLDCHVINVHRSWRNLRKDRGANCKMFRDRGAGAYERHE